MRVLTIIVSPGIIGGAENAAIMLSKALKPKIENKVLLMGEKEGQEVIRGLVVNVKKIKKPFYIPEPYCNIFATIDLDDEIGSERYDLVHIHNTHPAPMIKRIAKKCLDVGIPYIISTHGIVESTKVMDVFKIPLVDKLVDNLVVDPLRFSLQNASGIAALTNYEIELLKKFYGVEGNRIRVVRNGFDPIFEKKPKEEDIKKIIKKYKLKNEGYLLFVGNLKRNKGIEVLIDAMLMINRLDLAVVGKPTQEGYYKKLVKLVKEKSIQNRVKFLGKVSDRELVALYYGCRLFVLPTLADTLPLVILDAMVSKKAVVATRVGGIPEEIEDGVTGIIVEPNNVDELADEINKIIKYPEKVEMMGKAGYKKVINEYGWNRVVNCILDLYGDILGEKSGSKG